MICGKNGKELKGPGKNRSHASMGRKMDTQIVGSLGAILQFMGSFRIFKSFFGQEFQNDFQFPCS